MPGENSQHTSCYVSLLPESPYTETSRSVHPLQPAGSMMLSQYDRWLRRRPNTQWQNLENQTLIDQSRFDSGSLNKGDDASESEAEEEISSFVEPSELGGTDNGLDDKDEQISINDEEKIGSSDEISDCEESVNERAGGEVIIPVLRAMQDQWLRRDSIARLSQLFKSATLESVEEGTGDLKGSRILLEDRNFSYRRFRPYPRSMTPKQLYGALVKKASINSYT